MAFPARFEQYEIFRILIPGYYFVSVLACWFYTIPLPNYLSTAIFNKDIFSFIYVFGGLFFGLAIYAYDYPSKIEGFNANSEYEHLGNVVFEEYCVPCIRDDCNISIKNPTEAESTYFLIQYDLMGHKSQSVIQYFRSIHRVFTNIIGTSLLFLYLEAIFWMFGFLPYLFPTIHPLQNNSLLFTRTIFLVAVGSIALFLNHYNKGDEYLAKSIEFQENYILRARSGVESLICPRSEDVIPEEIEIVTAIR